MKINLTFTEEQIKLIKCLRFRKIDVKHEKSDLIPHIKYMYMTLDECDKNECSDYIKDELRERLDIIHKAARLSNLYAEADTDKYYGFDSYDFFMNDDEKLFLSYVLGYKDELDELEQKKLDGKLEQSDIDRHTEIMEHFGELMDFIFTNIVHIEDILHQRCDMGGIQPNVKYVALDHEGIWYTEEEFKEKKRKRK